MKSCSDCKYQELDYSCSLPGHESDRTTHDEYNGCHGWKKQEVMHFLHFVETPVQWEKPGNGQFPEIEENRKVVSSDRQGELVRLLDEAILDTINYCAFHSGLYHRENSRLFDRTNPSKKKSYPFWDKKTGIYSFRVEDGNDIFVFPLQVFKKRINRFRDNLNRNINPK